MKIPLYALAIAGIGAASYFSYQKVGEHETALVETEEFEKKAENLKSSIAKGQRKYDALPEQVKELKSQADVLTADIDDLELKKGNIESKITTLKKKSESLTQQLVESEEIIEKFAKAFEDEGVPVEGIADYTNQLKEESEALSAELEELLVAKEEVEAKLADGEKVLSDYQKRDADRSKSLNENSVSSLITAVNPDWGFVVIKPHANAKLTEETQLIVVRGGQSLARVNVSAVEPNRVIADIDADSLAAGVRVRSGDRVILAQVKSR